MVPRLEKLKLVVELSNCFVCVVIEARPEAGSPKAGSAEAGSAEAGSVKVGSADIDYEEKRSVVVGV